MFSKPQRIEPRPGQESVWDYPRPPRLEPVKERLRVVFAGITVAETSAGYRVLETSHPPVYYLPPADVRQDLLIPEGDRSYCEFKGAACYWAIEAGGKRVSQAAWSYPEPTGSFQELRDFYAFYASRVESCWVGDEKVQAQDGDFYGGWITAKIVGPFKGAQGTWGW